VVLPDADLLRASQVKFVAGHPVVRWLLEWVNPVAPFVESMRSILYHGNVGDWARVLYAFVAAAVAIVLGRAVFRRMEGELAWSCDAPTG